MEHVRPTGWLKLVPSHRSVCGISTGSTSAGHHLVLGRLVLVVRRCARDRLLMLAAKRRWPLEWARLHLVGLQGGAQVTIAAAIAHLVLQLFGADYLAWRRASKVDLGTVPTQAHWLAPS